MSFDDEGGPRRRRARAPGPPPGPPDRAGLLRAAQRYLQRYWPTVEQLRRVLRRRVPVGATPAVRAAVQADVEDVLAQLIRDGALDDQKAARSWAEQLDRRGLPRPVLRQKMRSKGLSGDHTEAALAKVEADAAERGVTDPELARVAAAAQRKRLGPFRLDVEARAEHRERDMARLARLGFPYGLVKQIIDAEDEDEALALATR